MVRVIVILLLAVALSFGGSLLDDLHNLSEPQKRVLHTTFKTAKLYNLEYSLTAIAWQESNFGKYLEGKTDDWGVFQITLKTFKGMYPKYGEVFTDDEIRGMLIESYDLNFVAAVRVIWFWQRVRGENNWRAVYSGYNGGYRGNPAYAEMIVKRIAALRIYMKEIK